MSQGKKLQRELLSNRLNNQHSLHSLPSPHKSNPRMPEHLSQELESSQLRKDPLLLKNPA